MVVAMNDDFIARPSPLPEPGAKITVLEKMPAVMVVGNDQQREGRDPQRPQIIHHGDRRLPGQGRDIMDRNDQGFGMRCDHAASVHIGK